MRPNPSHVHISGPLADYAVGFGKELLERGYPTSSAARHVRLLAQLSQWMESEGLGDRDLSEERLAGFLEFRRTRGYATSPSSSFVMRLLSSVPGLSVVPADRAPLTPLEVTVADYGRYLEKERGLAAATISGYLYVTRLFLSDQVDSGEDTLDLSQLSARAVIDFVVGESRRRSVGGSQVVVTAMRSFLRFLFYDDRIPQRLDEAVPAVSAPKGFLPRGLSSEVVTALLNACDTTTALGRRDLAVLTLLVRLGLRAGEVASPTLDDMDWHHGELVIRGKGSRRDRLPLPVDVGEALAAYLSAGRPQAKSRALVLRVHAPIGPMSASNVTRIVGRACERAGVSKAGAHRLRHSAATAMLQAGAPLSEVGQVLRQVQATTTAIYAKVDRVALRSLARPWPGALT